MVEGFWHRIDSEGNTLQHIKNIYYYYFEGCGGESKIFTHHQGHVSSVTLKSSSMVCMYKLLRFFSLSTFIVLISATWDHIPVLWTDRASLLHHYTSDLNVFFRN